MKVLFALFGLVAATVAAPSGILAGGYYGAAIAAPAAAIVRTVPAADAIPAGLAGLQNVAGAVVPLDTPAVAAARADHLSAKAAQTALVGPGLGYAAGIIAAPAAIAAPA